MMLKIYYVIRLCNINSGLIIFVFASLSIIINNMLRKGEELLRKLAMLSISRFSMSIGYPHSQQELAQEAEVAMHYVAEICKMDQTVPLIQRLIDLKVDSVDPAVLEKKRKLFVGGVPLDTIVFEQQRVKNAIKANKNSLNQDYFCFHPTTIVTTPVFKHLTQTRDQKSMIFGPYGISKTISIILHHQLSSDINRYLYLTSDQNRNDFMQNWARKNIKIPKKMIYWSIKLDQKQKNIVNILRRQCFQLNIKQSASTVKNFATQIIQAYNQKNMPCSVVIDQINNIAAVYRKYNKQMLEKTTVQEETKQNSIKARKAKIYSDSIRSIAINCNGTYFYNSSINIEEQLLGDNKNTQSTYLLTLDLDYHTEIHRQKIEYQQNIKNQVAKQEIDIIIAKQILTRTPTGIITKLWGEQAKMGDVQVREQTILKNEIGKARGTEGWQFYVRPLSIYSYISKNLSSITFGSKQELIASLSTVVKSLRLYSRNEITKKMIRFLAKEDRRSQQRKLVAMDIYYKALGKLRESDKNSNKPVFITKEQLLELDCTDPQQDLDRELFYKKENGFEMHFTMEQYTQIVSSQELSKLLNSSNLSLIKHYFQKPKYRATFGLLLQEKFNSYFQNHYKSIVLNFYLDKQDQRIIKFKNTSTFVHFNKSKGTVASHFQKMFQKCKNFEVYNPEYVFGVPVNNVNKGEAEQESGTSASIDMLMMGIINITKDDRKMFIYSFDFATAKTADNLQKKLGRNKVSSLIEKAKLQIKEELDALNSPAKESAKESGKDENPDKNKKKKQKQVKKVKWDVKQLEWTHYIVVSPEMEHDVRKPKYETKQVKNADGSESTIVIIPKYQNKLITFNSFKIIQGDKSLDRSVFEKGVELMDMAK